MPHAQRRGRKHGADLHGTCGSAPSQATRRSSPSGSSVSRSMMGPGQGVRGSRRDYIMPVHPEPAEAPQVENLHRRDAHVPGTAPGEGSPGDAAVPEGPVRDRGSSSGKPIIVCDLSAPTRTRKKIVDCSLTRLPASKSRTARKGFRHDHRLTPAHGSHGASPPGVNYLNIKHGLPRRGRLTLDHKRIGIMYTDLGARSSFFFGGLAALAVRTELIAPGQHDHGPGRLQPDVHAARLDHGVPRDHPVRAGRRWATSCCRSCSARRTSRSRSSTS